MIKVGIFWEGPDSNGGKKLLHLSKANNLSAADCFGFINYRYSHFEVWDYVRESRTEDCYEYPRGRVIYDANKKEHVIYADKCISEESIGEIIRLFGIENYKVCRDEHYVCRSCENSGEPELKYEILRGRDKIGENLIEISYGATRILVELGKSLDGSDGENEKAILKKPYSAVIVSHYHEDHAGLIRYKSDSPVYIGNGAYRVIKAMSEYRGEILPQNIFVYYNRKSFETGGIKITPFLCDHSAYDSYMLLFEAGTKSILYTGDFRFHGRKRKENLLSALPDYVDVLIHEGTNIGKNSCTVTEAELENKAVEIMKLNRGPVFVLQSGTNIDRLVSIYRASKRSGRITYMDNYTAQIAAAVGGKIPRPDVFADVIAFTPHSVHGKRGEAFLEITNKRGLTNIAKGTKRFTMFVRPTMLGYLKKLFVASDIKEAALIYSLWKGYKETESTAEFLNEMAELGANLFDLHTSGHASSEDIELLKRTVNARETVCVHTEFIC